MINWTEVLSTNQDAVTRFASGSLSRDGFLSQFRGTDVTGQVRRLVRSRGAASARKSARAALRRRGISV